MAGSYLLSAQNAANATLSAGEFLGGERRKTGAGALACASGESRSSTLLLAVVDLLIHIRIGIRGMETTLPAGRDFQGRGDRSRRECGHHGPEAGQVVKYSWPRFGAWSMRSWEAQASASPPACSPRSARTASDSPRPSNRLRRRAPVLFAQSP